MPKNEEKPRHICTKTVMDSSDPEISFDQNGVSSYWWEAQKKLNEEVIEGEAGRQVAAQIVDSIKRESEGRDYDCIIGLSGGVDSSYVALLVKQFGLNPLAVHVDNGWNSDLAITNIETIVKKLGIDLHTSVLDWPEFRDLQRSYFLASVPNCETPTDHAIVATLFRAATKFGIRHIISGANLATESIYQKNAGHDNKDIANLRDIHRCYGQRELRTYPQLSPLSFAKHLFLHRTQFIPILNYLDYRKNEAIDTLERELGWRRYSRKHGESTFTRFFQEHYLPTKFGIDKRRMHYSSLICSGQMARDEALKLLQEPMYEPEVLARELEYACKKLQFSEDEFGAIMSTPPKRHEDYRIGLFHRTRGSGLYRWARILATGRKTLPTHSRSGGEAVR